MSVTEAQNEPMRLDTWIAATVAGLSRRRAQQMIETGEITVNGRLARKGNPVQIGDTIELWSDPITATWCARPSTDIALIVPYHDQHIFAVEKQAGTASVPLDPREPDTLAGAIAVRFPECAIIGRNSGDSGLIQRLDRQTSGLMIGARTQQAFKALLDLQEKGDIAKSYLALVSGRIAELPQVIDTPLIAAGRGGRSVRATLGGTPAQTELSTVTQRGEWLLIEATIRRGLRHQIRAHLAYVGFPIAGDELYGGPLMPGLDRQFLHASRLSLPHPMLDQHLELRSSLPRDLEHHLPSASDS